MKGKTHDLNHELTFSAHKIDCVCHSIRSMFRVLGIYNFAGSTKSWWGKGANDCLFAHAPPSSTGPVMRAGVRSAVVKQATMVLDDV